MHGVQSQIPTRYPGVIALIEEYHWTYDQIEATPADLIDELLTRLGASRKWQAERNKRDQAKARTQAKNKGKR